MDLMEPTRNTPQIRAGLLAAAFALVSILGLYFMFNIEIPAERILPASLMLSALALLALVSTGVAIIEISDGMTRTFRHADGTPADPVLLISEREREEAVAQIWVNLTSAN